MRTARFLAACLLALPLAAFAQSYPNLPVKLMVPFAPGGATDVVARLLAQEYSETWGRQLLVESRPAARWTPLVRKADVKAE